MMMKFSLRGGFIGIVTLALVGGTWMVVSDHSTDPSFSVGTAKNDGLSMPGPVVTPWEVLAMDGLEVEQFESLDAMVTSADVTMSGIVESVTSGRTFSDSRREETVTMTMVELKILPEDVFVGASKGEPIVVEFGPFFAPDLEVSLPRLQNLVGERSIYALRRKGSGNPALGLRGDPDEFALNMHRLVTSQGLLDEAADGTTHAPLAELDLPTNDFLEELEGRSFDETLAKVDKMVGG